MRKGDEYNLVGERIKLDTSLSKDSDDSDDYHIAVGASKVKSVSKYIKKKPRPREIIHGITDKKARRIAKQK